MNEFESQILEAIRSKPDHWSIVIGSQKYSRGRLIREYPKDKKVRDYLVKIMMGLQLHMGG